MTLTPGSIPWLMRHELRLYLRSGVIRAASVTLLIIVEALLHLIAVGIVFGLRAANRHGAPDIPAGMTLILITAGLAFCFILMLSRALNGIIQVLYTRADLDLLLSSPLAPNSIIGVRIATVALTVTLEIALLVWPFANAFVLFGMFAWAKLYLLLPALAMLATSLGAVLALSLFRLLGPRNTRVIAQVLAALIGLGVFVLGQLPNLMRIASPRGPAQYGGFGAMLHADPARMGILLSPATLVVSGYWPSVLFTVATTELLLVIARVLSGRFVQAATAIGSMGSERIARTPAGPLRFSHSLRRVLIVKELRLLRRDPLLLMQLLQQAIYLVPVGFLLWRRSTDGASGLPWPWIAVIMACGTLATALAWVTVVAEDAPELLAAAPVTRTMVVRAKIEAALLPLIPLWLLPLAVLGRTHPWFAVLISLCSFGCSLSTALLQVYRPPAKRDAFKTRGKGSPGKSFVEFAIILAWMALCALLAWLIGRS